jgi:hypothetical protein
MDARNCQFFYRMKIDIIQSLWIKNTKLNTYFDLNY